MNVVAIIQARMGSTRLPGKVMLPLNDEHVLTHVIERTKAAETVDDIVVATSTKTADDIIARYVSKSEAKLFRGSETDVLDRMFEAATQESAGIVVRVTGDCPLVVPNVIDSVVNRLVETDADYSANVLERTFPRGLDVEAFTIESFERVNREATEVHHREHVTSYYHEFEKDFIHASVTSEDVFANDLMHGRTDLRLTLDEADDYELLRTVYENVYYEDVIDIIDTVMYIDNNNISYINKHVKQKSL